MAKATKTTRKSKKIEDIANVMAMATTETLEPEALEAIAALDEAPAQSLIEVMEIAALNEAPAEAAVHVDQATEQLASSNDSFDDIVGAITNEEKIAATVAMAKAVDQRMAFERVNGNENIQTALKNARKAFTSIQAGAALLACNVDEAFVNRSVNGEKRYNVYAFGKLADTIKGLTDGTVSNKINFAIMRSLFAARKAGIGFTAEMAKMCASDKIRIADAAIKAILVRHTVSEVTAATQASSTMQALETLGIVRREGSHKNPTFVLTDTPACRKLEEVMAKAA